MVWLGVISYSAYLYNAAYALTPLAAPLKEGHLWAALLAFITVPLFGAIGYCIAEYPFLRWRDLLRRDARTATVAAPPAPNIPTLP